jgi:hypothetical protein
MISALFAHLRFKWMARIGGANCSVLAQRTRRAAGH